MLAASIGASLIPLHAPAAPTTAYDSAAASTRAEFSAKMAKCKKLSAGARSNCMKAAKSQAQVALVHTHADAVAAARAAHASAIARCKPMNLGERRRCLRIAKAEYRMALGRAEEIRSAPLAMGMN